MFGKTIRIDSDEVLGCIAEMQQARLDYLENEDEESLDKMRSAMHRSTTLLSKLIVVPGTKIKVV